MQERENVRNDNENLKTWMMISMEYLQTCYRDKFSDVASVLINKDDSVLFPCQQPDSTKVAHNEVGL